MASGGGGGGDGTSRGVRHGTATLRMGGGPRDAYTYELATFRWEPAPAEEEDAVPAAAVVFVHGLHEHCVRYAHVCAALARRGVAAYAFDHKGHGRSTGERANNASAAGLEDLVDDAAAVVAEARKRVPPGTPFFAVGQSLGGLIAALLVLREGRGRWAGLVLTAPALDVEWTPVLRAQSLVLPYLAALLPSARIVEGVRPDEMCRTAEGVRDYVEDPLNTVGPVKLRIATAVLRSQQYLKPRYGDFKLPLLVLHGTGDRCTSLEASRAFVRAASSDDKTFMPLDGLYHTIFHEPEAPEVIERLGSWVLSRAAGPRQAPRARM